MAVSISARTFIIRIICMVQLMKKYDNVVCSQMEQSNNFRGLTPTMQIGLIESIEQTIHQRIIEEVSAVNFFSLIVDEINSDIEIKRISISIRYVKDGAPVERFIGLYEVNHGTKAEEVAAIVDRELEKFDYKNKMIAQSYDGKVVKAIELYSLQQAIKRQQNPLCQAQLVHYYAHDFRDILAHSLNSIQECKLFFSTIRLFCKFFQNLDMQQNKKLFESVPMCIMTLKNQYAYILTVLDYTTIDEKYENVPVLIADAINLTQHLKNFKFMIFVTMFEKIFSHIEGSIDLMKKNIDTNIWRGEINTLIKNLKRYKDKSEFTNLVIQDVIKTFPTSTSIIPQVFSLNVQILDSLIHEIEGRFLDIELSSFFALVGIENFTENNGNKKNLDGSLLLHIKENYPNIFDINRLKNELHLLYNDPSVGGFGECEIRHIKDILKFLYDNEIKDNIPELYKLLELVVSIPALTEPLEGKLCVLNRLNSYRSSDKKEEPVSGLALLAIETDLLLDIQKNSQWYSQVIDNFSKLPTTSSVELVYKDTTVEHSASEVKFEMISEPELEIKSEPDMF